MGVGDFMKRILELVGGCLLLIMVLIPIFYWSILPNQIPTHFGFTGQPDDYGPKSEIWSTASVGLLLYILLAFLPGLIRRFPKMVNWPLSLTEQNQAYQTRIIESMLRWLRVCLALTFAYIVFMTVRVAQGQSSSLGMWFLLIDLIVIPIVIFTHLALAFKTQT